MGAAALPVSAKSQVRDGQRVELYGFVFGELVGETHRTGRDRFLNIQPLPGPSGIEDESADAFFNVAASRIGLNVYAGTRAGAVGAANLEVDFDTPDGGPRIRHAFGELTKGRWRLLIGQTWAVVSQLNPATINSDNLYNLGNTYERVPQLRVGYSVATGPGTLDITLGAATFFSVFDQPGLAIQSDPGAPEKLSLESNTPPVVQGRLAYGWNPAGRNAHLAIGASAGRLEGRTPSGAQAQASHLLVAGEVLLPVSPSVGFMAEGFYGRGGGFNSGAGQTAVYTATAQMEPLRSWGGFAQFAFRVAPNLRFNAIGGIDDPETRPGGTDLAIGRNWTAMANVFWNVTERMTYAAELQYLGTEYEALSATAQNLRATVALFVHL